MSARQIRNLQKLVKASTGADEDDDDMYLSSQPSTMKPANTNKKSRKASKQSARQAQDPSEGAEDSLVAATSPLPVVTGPPAHTAGDDQCTSAPKGNDGPSGAKKPIAQAERPPVVSAPPGHSCDEAPPVEIDAKRKKSRGRRDNRARRREAELEDERLLVAALRRSGADAEAGATAESSAPGGPAMGEGGGDDLLALLSLCNPDWLDTRRERIRRFGPAAVGDMGDGRASQRRGATRATSNVFPPHAGPLPMFRHSCFATPNRYCWRAFNGNGVFLAVKAGNPGKGRKGPTHSQGKDEPVVFALSCASPEAQRADLALAERVMGISSIEELYVWLYQNPYHIPSLLLAQDVFKTAGNAASAQEVTNLALYHLGLLFSRFPIRQTSRQRQVPFLSPDNELIFRVLMNGVQMALDTGATRTAWELSKFVYSLDPSDPCVILPHLDYVALRAKAWGWLLHIYYIIANEKLPRKTATEDTEKTLKTTTDVVGDVLEDKSADSIVEPGMSLVDAISVLPGFFFNAALAKHFLERELQANAASGENVPGHKKSKVLRELSDLEKHAMNNTEPAATMLARAIRRFPSAAVLLFEQLGGVEATLRAAPPTAWSIIAESHARNVAANAEAVAELETPSPNPTKPLLGKGISTEALVHYISTLWAKGNAEIWRAAVPCDFLRRVVTEENGLWLSSPDEAVVPAKIPWTYSLLFGSNGPTTVIPAHLLDPHAVTEEDEREYQRHLSQELTPLENDALMRFLALFGPLSESDMSPAEQLERYAEMFEETDAVERVGAEYSRLGLFLRTLMPTNNLRDMALRATLRSEGIADPVAERNRRRREEDEEFWQQQLVEDEFAAFAELDGSVDEEQWSTEESWTEDNSDA